MKLLDYLKAGGVAFGLLIANHVIAIVAVTVYALLINPGQPSEFYAKAAESIVVWTVHICSPILFFITGYLLTRTRPKRNGLQFASMFCVVYAVIDIGIVGVNGLRDVMLLLSMFINLLAAVGGAFFAGILSAKTAEQADES